MAVRYKPNYRGIAAIGYSREMQAAMQAKADEAADTARQLAEPHIRTGDYWRSLHADSGQGRARDRAGGFRATSAERLAIGRLIADTPYAAFVEFGTSVMEAQAILRRAIEMTW